MALPKMTMPGTRIVCVDSKTKMTCGCVFGAVRYLVDMPPPNGYCTDPACEDGGPVHVSGCLFRRNRTGAAHCRCQFEIAELPDTLLEIPKRVPTPRRERKKETV